MHPNLFPWGWRCYLQEKWCPHTILAKPLGVWNFTPSTWDVNQFGRDGWVGTSLELPQIWNVQPNVDNCLSKGLGFKNHVGFKKHVGFKHVATLFYLSVPKISQEDGFQFSCWPPSTTQRNIDVWTIFKEITFLGYNRGAWLLYIYIWWY